jgi:hypothetical protein
VRSKLDSSRKYAQALSFATLPEKDPNQTEIDYNPPGNLTDGLSENKPNNDEEEVMKRLSENLK